MFLKMRSKLAALVLSLFIVVFILQIGLLSVSMVSVYKSQEQESVRVNELLLQQANNNYLGNLINQIDRGILQTYYNKVFWTDTKNVSTSDYYTLLTATYRLNEAIHSVYLYSNLNETLYIMDEVSYAQLPIYQNAGNNFSMRYPGIAEENWFRSATAHGGDLVVVRSSDMRPTASDQNELLCFSRSLSDPLHPDQLRYVISINLDFSFFEMLARQLCDTGEGLVITAADGTLIFSDMIGAGGMSDAMLADSIREHDSQLQIRSDDVDYLVLQNEAATGWRMLKIIPMRNLFAEARKTLWTNLLGTVFIFLLSCLLLVFVIRRVVRPINHLAETMENYTIQSKSIPVQEARPDEIGRLYRSFATMQNHIQRLITQKYELQIREKQSRIEALQAQVNPHFLNNTLQTITGIAVEHDVPEIEGIVSALSSILRYSLTKDQKLVTIREEIEIVKKYVYIQQFRYGERINLQLDCREETMRCLIPVLTLQLAVENAVRHGLETKIGRGIVRIYERETDGDDLELCVEDNGSGVKDDQLRQLQKSLYEQKMSGNGWTGNGLINMNERIRGVWGSRYGLTIEHAPLGGLLVKMRLPRAFEEAEEDDV